MMPGEGRFSDGRAGPFFGTPWPTLVPKVGFPGAHDGIAVLGSFRGIVPITVERPLPGRLRIAPAQNGGYYRRVKSD
jgi:hypothetical protein